MITPEVEQALAVVANALSAEAPKPRTRPEQGWNIPYPGDTVRCVRIWDELHTPLWLRVAGTYEVRSISIRPGGVVPSQSPEDRGNTDNEVQFCIGISETPESAWAYFPVDCFEPCSEANPEVEEPVGLPCWKVGDKVTVTEGINKGVIGTIHSFVDSTIGCLKRDTAVCGPFTIEAYVFEDKSRITCWIEKLEWLKPIT